VQAGQIRRIGQAPAILVNRARTADPEGGNTLSLGQQPGELVDARGDPLDDAVRAVPGVRGDAAAAGDPVLRIYEIDFRLRTTKIDAYYPGIQCPAPLEMHYAAGPSGLDTGENNLRVDDRIFGRAG